MTSQRQTDAPDAVAADDTATIAGKITWREGDVPFSPHFGDIYYNPKDGLAETRYVFLEGNHLPDAWQGRENFTIGETGFGTGLNFLAAWQAWDQDRLKSRRLHFVSVEKYPLSRADLMRAHQSWPELSPYAAALADVWPTETMLPGIQRFELADGAVTLTILVGDAITCWAGYDGAIDCWFLDGFAPSRNPDMWAPALFRALANASSKNGATLATFTAARIARDGLEGAGFEIAKRKGFGHKRDMITATLPAQQPGDQSFVMDDAPWFLLPTNLVSPKHIAIIGGGMAGAACARALQTRGCTVTLFEKNDQLAAAASGNPIGMLEPYLTADHAIMGRFYEAGFRYSHRMIKQLADTGKIEADFCGVLDLITNDRQQERQNGLMARLPDAPDLVRALSREQASATFGMDLPAGGLFYPSAGWVNPPSLVHELVNNIDCRTGTPIAAIRNNNTQRSLITASGDEIGPFDAIVIAGAMETAQLGITDWLSEHLRSVRGQISYLPATRTQNKISCVLSHDGYLTPARDGIHVCGATFGRDDDQTDLRTADHDFNITQLSKILPTLTDGLSVENLSGRASIRTTTGDHLPVVGPAPDFDAYVSAYGDIDKGKKHARYERAPYHAGVYICTGFGARGLIGAPLAAEIIASEICAMPLPLEKDLMDALHPARFIVRGLKRRQIPA
ncbi:bifunctional tRNA (5-methylaminomethyl-2-thiouridine)(34)-methyltransferase MnmD/FAD-dependent 5-carboxymethylaminomethyl-2-thiouridine(34) oxidoreductase MnmC [Thalassospira sp. MA62]|nr:bifunctional tRNA (5-methylaminomethyl-2-thiouridine)(34)-methyltransferase MnmD/FAD-dependent 5-carboxymethylaminomethyl-2-thiouridine(34) oxidoreductase MnmC [Thalassospira sp. MA62]